MIPVASLTSSDDANRFRLCLKHWPLFNMDLVVSFDICLTAWTRTKVADAFQFRAEAHAIVVNKAMQPGDVMLSREHPRGGHRRRP